MSSDPNTKARSAKRSGWSAERWRLYQRRLRLRTPSCQIRIDDAKINALVRRGYLEPSERDDPIAIEQAANLFVWDSLAGKSRRTKRA
jgi:hypothetical protein